ncbi:MAG: trifunctional serine/threonine-protein kinase/ATP-binding protein/sensor histidine kinase [Spirulinaceae cyanobacterium]
MFALAGYQDVESIYAGTRTLVHRAIRLKDKQPVIVKVLRNPHPHFSELVQFRNQYVITRHLEHPHIVRPLNLERYGNGYALVMPDRGAVSLPDYWQASQLSLPRFLAIGIQLADALHYLRQQRIIHKDIKPANILIHPDTGEIELIDFSIASLLPKEQQQFVNPNQLEGTLAYISPEQTGRMNRGIDYRTDFYSLGVTFYELLTGELPFESSDPMDLLHSHIAKAPPLPHEQASVPISLSELTLKLMAKDVEDRYQSALGLKHDLERCLTAWEATESIPVFSLGERDVCDRFIIPEKLYGREAEVQSLLDAFDRVAAGNTELMLVAGFSGIGKTAVVNEVHKPIVAKRGYFIKGKFDQFNRNIPFSAFVQAFRDLMGQLLGESERELAQWRSKISTALGENGQVLVDVIPELEQVIGPQPSVPELSGSAAQNRFNLLFQNFIDVFTNADHPLVMFLDDLQWADSASLNLLEVLLKDRDTGYLLLLGAYRDNEVSPTHPLMLTLAELEKAQAAISTLTLGPLKSAQINQLVAATLGCELTLAEPLTNLVYQKTKGNPFFTTQFLKGLYEDALIAFNPNLGYWECDLVKVQDAALTDDVVEFMVGRLRKLPMMTQRVLKLAACIGNRFDLETLAIVCDRPRDEVASDLWLSLQAGSVVPESETYRFFQGGAQEDDHVKDVIVSYRFLHDRVQQAAYSLIEAAQKQATHLKIGQLLLKSTHDLEGDDRIFDIVNHLNISWQLMEDESERVELAGLNLEAGKKAKASTAYVAALEEYFSRGIEILPEEMWQKHYGLTFSLYRESSECEYLCGNFGKAEKLFDEIINRVNSDIERAEIQNIRATLYDNTGKYSEAIKIIAETLKRFGLDLPIINTDLILSEFEQELERYNNSLKQIKISELLDIRPMSDPGMIACMKILATITGPAYFTNQDLCALISLKMVNISIEQGNSESSALGYAFWGIMVGSRLNDYKSGYEFGQLGLQLTERFNNPNLACKTLNLFGGLINPWRSHLKEGFPILRQGYKIGSELLDVWATYNGYHLILQRILCAEDLDSILMESQKHLEFCKNTRNDVFAGVQRLHQGIILNLRGLTLDEVSLSTEDIDEQEYLQTWQETSFMPGLAPYFIFKAQILYSYGRCEEALEMIRKSDEVIVFLSGIPSQVNHYFYYSLILAALYPVAEDHQQKEYARIIEVNQKKMKFWADNCPENFLHKYILVEAEKARNNGRYLEAIDYYGRAIAEAVENGYLQEEALANELAARFYLEIGQNRASLGYMQEAYYCYSRWGAKAKTDDLEVCYPQLLEPILQQTLGHSFSVLETVSTMAVTDARVSTQVSNQATHSSSSTINASLDFATILRAAQLLTSTIDLDTLIEQLTQIILQNSGGDRGVLVLPDETGNWLVKAIATPDATQICLEPLEKSVERLPVKLIQYAKNTNKIILIDEGKFDGPVLSNYVLKYQPRSGLCLPMLNQGQLMGVLYLENRVVRGVFTPDRQIVINFLSSQSAIALKNAQLYGQVQHALQDLQQTQLQLVQNEKMSALGNLVAGVAHEINNPTGFLRGNIQPAKDYVQDLFGFLDFLLGKLPAHDPDVQDEMEDMDLAFIREDLPKILNSMTLGVDRIRNISNSLRVFSRKDQDYKTIFDIHDGIESTLLILKHRTKANEHRPPIQIIKDYGELPEVQCFPGQLNQVFMNLLANAIDAFDEANRGLSFAEIEANPNCITIRTGLLTEQQVQIQIQDNGCGMSPETQARIFEQGFTTKGVGKGTGLGMAIAHQIVTEKHQGIIDCQSELGQGTTFTITLPLQ